MDFVEELSWRGMVHNATPGVREKLAQGMAVGYAGFDPTAPSLQVGNLAAIMMLVHFQRAGHKPLALVGGATGMIGDPSGRSEERCLISEEEIRHNVECVRKQLCSFLEFDAGRNAAEIVNNYDWFRDIGFLEFLRDVGKHLTVGYMAAKESVRQRLESGISFTEFSYQLLQGFDFYWLYENKGCIVQLGGADQWGNITSGAELVRRKAGGEAHAVTCPLVTRSDGTKFGKSACGESLWLDPEMTSPYRFYQFWLNVTDDEAARFLRVFSLLSREEILEIEKQQTESPNTRPMQKRLAGDVTVRVHSDAACRQAVDASEILFGKGTTETLKKLSEKEFLDIIEGVPCARVARSTIEGGVGIIDFLTEKTEIFSSRGEARRMIKAGGLSINKSRITDEDAKIDAGNLLNGKYVLVRKGRKNYHLVEAK